MSRCIKIELRCEEEEALSNAAVCAKSGFESRRSGVRGFLTIVAVWTLFPVIQNTCVSDRLGSRGESGF